MIKIGIIGLGHMGGYHAKLCQASDQLQLIAIADPHEPNWGKVASTDVIKSANYQEWLSLVDAVIIATPTAHHFSIARECLLAGKHLLIEKPITSTITEAEELFAIAHGKNLVLHVGHVERFNGAFMHVKSLIKNPYFIETHRMGPFSTRPAQDSVIIDLMIHDIDLILQLVSSGASNVQAVGQSIRTMREDIALANVQFTNGALARFMTSRVAHTRTRTMSIHQEHEHILLDFNTQEIILSRMVDNNIVTERSQYNGNALAREIDYFVQSIKTGHDKSNASRDLAALALTCAIQEQCHASRYSFAAHTTPLTSTL